MALVIDEQDAGHAVLTVRGDFILDNKRDKVCPWQETGDRDVKREGAHGLEWIWVGDKIALVVAANL
jgi:predicted transglutaminase-like cysteine proteinase